jgi:hypothetical protein
MKQIFVIPEVVIGNPFFFGKLEKVDSRLRTAGITAQNTRKICKEALETLPER